MAKSSIAALLLVCALTGCAAPGSQQVHSQRGEVRVVDDAMNTHVLVLSPEFPQEVGGPRFDVRLQAAINRKTGATAYAVRVSMTHSLAGWFFPQRATFLDSAGEARTATGFQRERGDVSCLRYGCSYTEGASFIVPRAELDQVTKAVADGQSGTVWRLRLYGERAHVDAGIPPQALAAFLKRVDLAAATITRKTL